MFRLELGAYECGTAEIRYGTPDSCVQVVMWMDRVEVGHKAEAECRAPTVGMKIAGWV